VRWLLIALVFVCGLSLFPKQTDYRRTVYKTNVAAPHTLVARFDFPIYKEQSLLRLEQEQAQAAVPPVLVRHDSVQVAALTTLESLRRTILDLRRNRLEMESDEHGGHGLSQNAYPALFTHDAEEIFREAAGELRVFYDRGIVSEALEQQIEGCRYATLVVGGRDRVTPTDLLISPLRIRQLKAVAPAGRQQAIGELVQEHAWPNVTYDEAATRAARQFAKDAVDPTLGTVAKGDTIVEVRRVINEEILRKLDSYEIVRAQRVPSLLLRERVLSFVGRAMILALALAGLVLYLVSYRPEIVADLSDATLLSSLLGLGFLVGGLTLNVLHLSGYLIPVAAFAVVIAMLYDERLALVTGVMMTAAVGLVNDGGLDFIVVIGLGTAVAILSVRQLRDRRQLYRLLLFVPLVHLVARAALALIQSLPFEEMLGDALYLVANPFIAAGIALFAVPLSETLFEKCTDLTLLELLDLNRPLLRRLMLAAPGTYHHALMVGTLADAGASAIGANAQLARVIGYYHDIGKMKKPDYFIENLTVGSKNPHDKLAPAMSRLILESHVRDGVALAREFNLPRVVRDGIVQHHGTGLMTYFYHRAVKKDPLVPETEYRYPGPKPRSREAAIVLLADQVDAAARSLEDPTPSRLRGLVKQLIEKRALEGELDESCLTLRDLAALREAFIPILVALFHGRVSYPTMEPSRGKAAARSPAEPAAKAES
jgi:putative nucleotidyltransferase with HDIG domain